MKIVTNAELSGHEIIATFINKLKENNLSPAPENIKIMVLNKNGEEVEITPNKVVLRFNESKE
jgi:hypothetical protein